MTDTMMTVTGDVAEADIHVINTCFTQFIHHTMVTHTIVLISINRQDAYSL